MAEVCRRVESRQQQDVRAASRRGQLKDAKELIGMLSMAKNLTTEALLAALEGQYILAKERRYRKWTVDLRKYAEFLLSPDEIDHHFPMPGGNQQPQTSRGRTALTEDRDDRGIVRDVRLQQKEIPPIRFETGEDILPHILADPNANVSRQSARPRDSEEGNNRNKGEGRDRPVHRSDSLRREQRRSTGSMEASLDLKRVIHDQGYGRPKVARHDMFSRHETRHQGEMISRCNPNGLLGNQESVVIRTKEIL